MALHVPKAPGMAQMMKDGARVSLITMNNHYYQIIYNAYQTTPNVCMRPIKPCPFMGIISRVSSKSLTIIHSNTKSLTTNSNCKIKSI